MATLTIRNLDQDLKASLRVRAAIHGQSMEEEVRTILRYALRQPDDGRRLGQRLVERFRPVAENDFSTSLATNVISEFMRPALAPLVVAWIDTCLASQVWVSAISRAGIEFGIALSPFRLANSSGRYMMTS